MPAPCSSARSVPALTTSPSRSDVLVLGSTNNCCSYLLFSQELQPAGGHLCHGYTTDMLRLRCLFPWKKNLLDSS